MNTPCPHADFSEEAPTGFKRLGFPPTCSKRHSKWITTLTARITCMYAEPSFRGHSTVHLKVRSASLTHYGPGLVELESSISQPLFLRPSSTTVQFPRTLTEQ